MIQSYSYCRLLSQITRLALYQALIYVDLIREGQEQSFV